MVALPIVTGLLGRFLCVRRRRRPQLQVKEKRHLVGVRRFQISIGISRRNRDFARSGIERDSA